MDDVPFYSRQRRIRFDIENGSFTFDELRENDLLFVDSSHVLKAGSDLTSILFEILPRLRRGVVVHFHDIRFPFRYSDGITNTFLFWNEAYALQSFLTFNERFEIAFWLNHIVNSEHRADAAALLPLDDWRRHSGGNDGGYTDAGGSLYLRVTNAGNGTI